MMSVAGSLLFDRYVGIDYSGAKTPTASLPGLRVYEANRDSLPVEVQPPPSPRKYWTRRGIAEWLMHRLAEDQSTIVGIDHGFSFPKDYFDKYGLESDWYAFLADFHCHWPTDEDRTSVEDIRRREAGDGNARSGSAKWRRITEQRAGAAKSVFHFDVQGSVAKSTHAGLPWLRRIKETFQEDVHFWPFDGWELPEGRSVVAEVYPSLWSRRYPPEGRTADQHDAYAVSAWMRDADRTGNLMKYLHPQLTPEEIKTVEIEGWILGVM